MIFKHHVCVFLELVRGLAADQNLKSRATVTSSYVSRPLSSSPFTKASSGVFIGTCNYIWLVMANLDFSATCVSISGSTGPALAGRHILAAHHQITADQLLAHSFASHFSLKGISIKKEFHFKIDQTDPTHLLKHLAGQRN